MLLITGSTGFVGRHFTYRALERDLAMFALARGRDGASARDRVVAAVDAAAASYYEVLDTRHLTALCGVLDGDITVPLCGVDADWIAEHSGSVDEFWHIAASVEFDERKAESIYRQNVDGTRNALALAAALGVKRFIYVSTAYTAGRATGLIAEELHPGPREFNNCYERTKWQAEHLVAERCAEHGIAYTIVRPSIVIGPSTTKRTGGSETGVYGFSRQLKMFEPLLTANGAPIAISGDPDTPVNVVPVDRVVEEMLAIRDSGAEMEGRVFHVTADNAPLVGPSIAHCCELVGVPPIDVRPHHAPETPLEVLVARRIEFYSSYLHFPKTFARARKGGVSVSLGDLRQFIHASLREHRRETADVTLRRVTVTSQDGCLLAAYDGGTAQKGTVVFVNAFGMPAEFMMPLARDLMDEYRVVTWECRGVPSLSGDLSKSNAGLDNHVGDLNAILEAVSVVEPVHVVGWCSGTSVAHRFARVFPDKVASLSLLNGAYFLSGVATTKFQETVRLMMPQIANNPAMATFFFTLLFQRRESDLEEGLGQVQHLLDGIHPSVLHMTSLPFQSARSLYRYALLINATFEDPEERFVGTVERPTLLVAGKKDQVAHYEGSTAVASRCPAAEIVVSEIGDHYSFYFDNRTRREIVSFIDGASAA